MSGSNFKEGVETPPSAVPGEKSPVLLGLIKQNIKNEKENHKAVQWEINFSPCKYQFNIIDNKMK